MEDLSWRKAANVLFIIMKEGKLVHFNLFERGDLWEIQQDGRRSERLQKKTLSVSGEL